MKKLLNKSIIGIISIIIGFICLQFYKDTTIHTPKNNEPAQKVVEITQTSIKGYQNHKISWTISSNYIWAGTNIYMFTAKNVFNGKIFDSNGNTVIDHIIAGNVNVNTQSKTLAATERISARFVKRAQKNIHNAVMAKDKETTQNIAIKSDNLRYFSADKKTYFYGNVIVEQGKSKIYTDSVQLDNDKNIAYIDTGFKSTNDEYTVSGNQMSIYIDDDYLEMFGNISGTKERRPTTNKNLDEREIAFREKPAWLTCDYLKNEFNDKNEYKITLKGNIHLYQPDKSLWGEEAYYNSKDNFYMINNQVRFKSDNLTWAIKKKQLEAYKNQEIKQTINAPTTLSSNKMSFNATTKELIIKGTIHFEQKKQKADCDTAILSDTDNILKLTGHVSITKENKDKIKCEEITIDLGKEIITAKNGIDSEFQIQKKKKSN